MKQIAFTIMFAVNCLLALYAIMVEDRWDKGAVFFILAIWAEARSQRKTITETMKITITPTQASKSTNVEWNEEHRRDE